MTLIVWPFPHRGGGGGGGATTYTVAHDADTNSTFIRELYAEMNVKKTSRYLVMYVMENRI
jgi:hypothetical protein